MSYNNNTPIVKHIITTYKLICINLVPRLLAKTLVGAGHVNPQILGVNSIWSQGGVVEEPVCCVWKIATLCVIISGDKNVICNKRL
jgi:hypothetical protein